MTSEPNLKDWDIGTEFEFVKPIGRGSYAIVGLAIHKRTKKMVAIKKFLNLHENITNTKRVLREIHFLKNLHHPNIASFYEVLTPKDIEHYNCLYIVMEYIEGDLKKLIKSNSYLVFPHIQKIIYNVLVGLKYMHSAGVLHRDIKPGNILVNSNCIAKICDFGLGRSVAGVSASSVKSMQSTPLVTSETDTFSSAVTVEEEKAPPIKLDLEEQKTQKRGMKRELTGHVATRWYRAPEIIIMEKDYGPGVDVWSVGCIFAELLTMIKGNATTYKDRHPLFPGTSCFPLSPNHKNKTLREGISSSGGDQLGIIFEVIGTPEEEDMKFITDPKSVKYLQTFKPRSRVDFKTKFPICRDDALDLLNRMLLFDPTARITVDECLAHRFFLGVRKKTIKTVSSTIIELPFENGEELTKDKLRELFLEEINYYKKLRDEGKDFYA